MSLSLWHHATRPAPDKTRDWRRGGKRRTAYRPQVEPMENRCLLATGPTAGLVADIMPGAEPSKPEKLVNANVTLYVSTYAPTLYPKPTRSMWKSDGTPAGTEQVAVTVGEDLTPVGSSVYF